MQGLPGRIVGGRAHFCPFTRLYAMCLIHVGSGLRLQLMLVIKAFSCVPSLHLQPIGTTLAEQAEIQQLLADENVEVLTEEDRDRLTQLDSLTGVPRGDDILLFALPMCAPYQVCPGCCVLQCAQLHHQVSTDTLRLKWPHAGVQHAFQ